MRHADGEHVAVVDLGYGDAGKGTVVDHLCARAHGSRRPVRAVVRFNGGAQAAHNVVTDDGRHHTFAQFGSGTFTPGVATHLSRFMLVDPLALATEADHLASVGVPDALDRLTVDRDALLTTPFHAAANQARERARGAERHGSCGLGVGETASFALAHPDLAPRAGDTHRPALLRRKLAAVRDALTAELGDLRAPAVEDCADVFAAFGRAVRLVDDDHLRTLLRAGRVVFEGAQGVLLDEWHGFHPYTTWSTTTFANADTLLADAGAPAAVRLGVVRTYTPRHGPGPLVTEDPALTAALPDAHNGTGAWQGAFRTGHFDAVAHRYAVEVCGGVDAIALTHTDAAERHPLRVCDAYTVDGVRVTRLPAGAPSGEPPASGAPDPVDVLDRQARLTARLLRAVPDLGPVVGPSAWPETVGRALGRTVTLVSSGPRTGDKAHLAPIPSGNMTAGVRQAAERVLRSSYDTGQMAGIPSGAAYPRRKLTDRHMVKGPDRFPRTRA